MTDSPMQRLQKNDVISLSKWSLLVSIFSHQQLEHEDVSVSTLQEWPGYKTFGYFLSNEKQSLQIRKIELFPGCWFTRLCIQNEDIISCRQDPTR